MAVEHKDCVPSYVGIDISKDKLDICYVDHQGVMIRTRSVRNITAGYGKIIEMVPESTRPIFSVESTGPYSGNLFNYLKTRGYDCRLANAFEVSILREAFS